MRSHNYREISGLWSVWNCKKSTQKIDDGSVRREMLQLLSGEVNVEKRHRDGSFNEVHCMYVGECIVHMTSLLIEASDKWM